jgi:hypothetical protein
MDEKFKPTLQKIKALAEQNPEFAQELRKMFEITPSAVVVSSQDRISKDVTAIREALEIRANASVSYSFVSDQRLRDQLIIDNLRMENAALNLKQSEKERFYIFCVNAFYQLENIVNYYFHETYRETDDLLSILENYTEKERSEDFKFKRKGNEKNVGDIQISHKINALCNILFPNDKIKITLGQLRQVRNEGEHRCMIILQEKDENNYLYRFFKYNTFNSIRIYLIKIVKAIKENIGKPIVEEKIKVPAAISSMLPSTCYVKFEEKTEQIPAKLFSKVKGLDIGDLITLVLSNNRIVDVLV